MSTPAPTPHAADWPPALAHSPLFARADAALVREALAGCERLRLVAGERLLHVGDANQRVFIPLSGELRVQLQQRQGEQDTLAIAPGECVGELSAIDGKPVSADVVAATDTEVLAIAQDVFWNRLMTLPGVAPGLLTQLSERVRRSTEQALRAQSERLELRHLHKELAVASQLQTSMLPLQQPLFPGRTDIEASGLMEPAAKVGGDLFDAFFVRERLLFFCIGDVSGHGIASALFMARAIGLIRILAMNTPHPERLLKKLNDRLCEHNDTFLFVTLFCAFLDLDSGRMVYANGGHCPPLLDQGGVLRELPLPQGPLVGALASARFLSMTHQLAPGDTLYCYTDGVTEAQTPAGEEFGEARCLDLLGALGPGADLQQTLRALRQAVAAFTGSEALEDDFTMLAVRRPAPPAQPIPSPTETPP
jgi:sigma-B regulation protein RsbU (phosphoserine phosphatase)